MRMLFGLLTEWGSPLPWLLLGGICALAAAAGIVTAIRRLKKLRRQSVMLGTQLRDIGEFAVEEARCTLAHCTKEPRRFFGKELPWMREQCIFTIDVIVRIGFDFEAIDVKVDHLRREITLRLPEMRILSSAVDYASMTIFDEKTGVFARPKLEWHRDSMLHLTREAEEKAIACGAFERAHANAKMRLEVFVGKLYDLTEYRLRILCPEEKHEYMTAGAPSACA